MNPRLLMNEKDRELVSQALQDYKLKKYNGGEGKSHFARYFNRNFPSYATEICIVAQKSI